MQSTSKEDEEKTILQWFQQNGLRVKLDIGSKDISTDPEQPNWQPDHEQKHARVYKVVGSELLPFRVYKMDSKDTALDSLRRAKDLLEADHSKATQEARDAMEAHVIPKLENCECPVCKSVDWRISESIFEMREFFGLVGTGQVIPVVLATCHICGHILPFNAIHVGALKQVSEKKR